MRKPNKRKLKNNYPIIENSKNLLLRATGLIPGCTQTLAKGPTQWVNGVAPSYLEKGKGARVWDVDGNEYLDYNMAIGPIILGYGFKETDEAIIKQLKKGITFSLMHPLEVELSEKISEIVPNAQSVRFSKTGADVTSAAVRLARAYTGRKKVLCYGYHGWHDWYIGVTDRNGGIPEEVINLTYSFIFNDIKSVKRAIDKNTACVILEPAIFEEPKKEFLYELESICHKNGALLIFDEMWTGFRMALGGAQEYFDIVPDLATYSKAIANGMPLSVLTGKADIMQLLDKKVFFYTTFGGETLSLAAALATINYIKEHKVTSYISSKGKKIKDGYNKIAEKLGMNYTKCIGYDFRSMVVFNTTIGNPLEIKSFVQQEMIKRGILWCGFHNMCYSHTDKDIQYTLEAYEDVLTLLKKAISEKNVSGYLKGNPIEPVFRKTANFPESKK